MPSQRVPYKVLRLNFSVEETLRKLESRVFWKSCAKLPLTRLLSKVQRSGEDCHRDY